MCVAITQKQKVAKPHAHGMLCPTAVEAEFCQVSGWSGDMEADETVWRICEAFRNRGFRW